jgi:hypothetical protein
MKIAAVWDMTLPSFVRMEAAPFSETLVPLCNTTQYAQIRVCLTCPFFCDMALRHSVTGALYVGTFQRLSMRPPCCLTTSGASHSVTVTHSGKMETSTVALQKPTCKSIFGLVFKMGTRLFVVWDTGQGVPASWCYMSLLSAHRIIMLLMSL